MVTRRTDARRRRVLSEEFVPTDESAVGGDKKPMQAYSYGANRRNQPKTTDMIPKRAGALFTFFLIIFSLFAGLNLLAYEASSLTAIFGQATTGSFAISGPGTLSNWVCCVSLFLCSGICLQLFFLRKHKRDDYGGMYRVWILMAAMFLLASIDCAIDLRTIAAKLFGYLTRRSLLQTPWLMMTIELIVLAVIIIRMLFEVRASRFTLASVLLVWVGFVGCIISNNSNILSQYAWVDQQVAYGNCILVGCVGSLVALTFYARFVFLHAHGLIQLKVDSPAATKAKPAKKAKPKPAKEAQAKPAKEAQTTTAKPARKAAVSKTKTKPAPEPAPKPTLEPAAKSKPAANAGPLSSRLKKSAAAKPPQPPAKAKPKTKPVVANQPQAADSSEDPLQEQLDKIDSSAVSKAERRRLRKLAKRTAREKKAA